MKDKLSKFLKMARKQMAVLICAAIALVSLVLAYWPTQSWYTELSGKVQKSVSDGGNMDKLLKLERHLPNINSDPTAPTQVLPVFPTAAIVGQGKQAVQAFDEQSKALLTLAAQLNEHFPLTPNALPAGGNVDRDKFARDFKAAMADDSYIRAWPPAEIKAHFQNLFAIPDLAAGQAPSADQIAAKVTDVANNVQALFGAAAANNPDMARQVAAQTKDELLKMFVDRANGCKVYLQPGAIKPPNVATNFANAVAALPPSDIWAAQLWLWTVQDAVTAVARANADAKNVCDSPVKQILDLTVKEPPYLVSGDQSAVTEITPMTPVYDVSPTGRVSNGMYDVLQFSMSLDVDADKAPQVLDLLEQGQFLTIVSVQYTALDSSEKAMKGFVYGNARIVKMDLICEDLFLKSWSSKYCPPGITANTVAGAAGGGANPSANLMTITSHAGGQ